MEQRNEPSTAEIASAIRTCSERDIPCERCAFKDKECGDLDSIAADRLEQQERTIADLTARAESAERERDAAVNALTLYEDALFDECDKSYQSGFMDGFRSREEIDDED